MMMRRLGTGLCGAVALFVIACSGSDAASPAPAADGGAAAQDAAVAHDGGAQAGNDAATSNADAGGGGDDASQGADSAAAPDTGPTFGPYPSGPYGIVAGAVIQNFTWQGYVDDAADALATTKPYVAYSLDDVRKSGKKYAMINLAEFYCPGCQKSAGELSTDGKAVIDAGGIVIEVLMTTGFTLPSSKTDLDSWIGKYAIPVTTVKDPDGTGTPTYNALGQREQAYIVDLSTMKILQVISGSLTGATDTSVKKGLLAMHSLLGK